MSAFTKQVIFDTCVLFAACLALMGATTAQSQNKRCEMKSEAGQTLLIVEQEYLGKKPPPNMSKLPHDPAEVDTDFYRLTYRNVSGAPIHLTRYALGIRHGAGILYGVKSERGAARFGGGLKEMNLKLQTMIDKNTFPVDYRRSFSHWVSSPQAVNHMDREIAIEQDGKQSTLRWSMQ